ncbi:MAG: LamG domain-containing protein, partial [Candidatus Micrarchaeota archaeon]
YLFISNFTNATFVTVACESTPEITECQPAWVFNDGPNSLLITIVRYSVGTPYGSAWVKPGKYLNSFDYGGDVSGHCIEMCWDSTCIGVATGDSSACEAIGMTEAGEPTPTPTPTPTPSPSVSLESTYGTNRSHENLTASYTPDVPGEKKIWDWRVTSSPPASIAVLNMPFEGGSNSTWTRDYSTNGNNGTVNGAAWSSTSGYDGKGAYSFDGTDDYIEVPAASSLDMTTQYTLEAWVYPRELKAYEVIFNRGAADADDIEVYVESPTSLTILHNRGNGGTLSYVQSWVPPPASQWTHLAVTYDAGALKLYYNSALKNSTTGIQAPLDTNKKWLVGTSEHSVFGGTKFFNGTIDEVRFYNRTLSQQEIIALYQGQTSFLSEKETNSCDVWRACATPNDGTQDGNETCSADLTITSVTQGKTPPSVTSISLNATDHPLNTTDANLTLWTTTDSAGAFYEEDFGCYANGVDPTNWTEYGGTWSVQNEKYSGYAQDNTNSKVSILASQVYRDYSASATVNMPVSEDYDAAGVVLRFVDSTHYYICRISERQDLFIIAERGGTGDPWYLNSTAYTVDHGVDYYINFTASGSSLSCTVTTASGYSSALTATDASNPAGAAGLEAHEANALFDDFRLEASEPSVQNIINWFVDNESLAVLNIPFEGGSNSTWTKDYSGHGNHGTPYNDPTWEGESAVGAGAYYFDGVNDGLTVADSPSTSITTGGLTLTGWVNINNFAGGGSNMDLFGKEGSYRVSVNRASRAISETRLGTDWVNCDVESSTALNASQWTFIAAVWDGAEYAVYINGVKDSWDTTGCSGTIADNEWNFSVAYNARYTSGFANAWIDDVKLYNRTLTPAQIQVFYQNELEKIHSDQTSSWEVWKACVTPNDGAIDGSQSCSNEVQVRPQS